MKRYIALLRGVNISGKNKIAMAELKAWFINLGYQDVITHLNSGNVVFSADGEDTALLAEKIRAEIEEQSRLNIPVLVISQEGLQDILCHAPDWWGRGEKTVYDNLIFVLPSSSAAAIAEEIGAPSKEWEQVQIYQRVIFWSFLRETYAKAHWWKKTAQKGIGERITIRTANTIRKLAGM